MTEEVERTEVRAVHPAAELFPMMKPVELKQLAEDIQKHGLLEPILVHEGKILDGRNRLAACALVSVEPRFDDAALDGRSPALYIVSKNLHRRHLTTSQRAAIGATLMPLLREEARERRRQGSRDGGHIAGNGRPQSRLPVKSPEAYSTHETNELRGESRSIAAKAVNAGGKTIQTAAAVMARDPEEFQRVLRGEIGVDAAYRKVVAAEAKAGGQAVPASGKRHQIRQQAARRRMIEVVSQIRGMCRGVKEMNIPLIAAVLSPQEKRAFAAIGRETSLVMRDFARALEAQS
jgi:hypothetical protein